MLKEFNWRLTKFERHYASGDVDEFLNMQIYLNNRVVNYMHCRAKSNVTAYTVQSLRIVERVNLLLFLRNNVYYVLCRG